MTGSISPGSPAARGFRMPAETALHDRMLMAWPCRRELWGTALEEAKRAFATVANTIAAFEPVTMVVADQRAALEAQALLTAAVDVFEIPIDDSWVRDSGPIFALDDLGNRAGVHFRFNAWGEKFTGWDHDEAAGGVLAAEFSDEVISAPIVLEGGSLLIDDQGRVVTTEQCLLAPNRNPELDQSMIEEALRAYLGATEVIWLGRGLVGDRDTDGHVDCIATFNDAGQLVLQSRPPGDPDHEAMAENRDRAIAAGLDVVDFPPLSVGEVAGVPALNAYLNVALCNGGVIVPLAGGAARSADEEALDRLAVAFPDREVVGVPGLVIGHGGGGPHCITQQVPARRATS
ncbi:MAG: agmatine deiminase family protein [Actinomycetes bacterium]